MREWCQICSPKRSVLVVDMVVNMSVIKVGGQEDRETVGRKQTRGQSH